MGEEVKWEEKRDGNAKDTLDIAALSRLDPSQIGSRVKAGGDDYGRGAGGEIGQKAPGVGCDQGLHQQAGSTT